MATTEFALPQSSWSELKRMIEAYFHADSRSNGEPVTVPDVAGHAALDATRVSRNNKFFQSIGVIEGGQKKRVTEAGKALGLSISHEDTAGIQRTLARLVTDSDFLSRIQSAVKVRSGMDTESLERHIAITAGAPKSKRTTTGARALIELLVDSGVLAADDAGTYRAQDVAVESEGDSPPADAKVEPALGSRVRLESSGSAAVGSSVPRNVTINLTINLTAENLDTVEPLLRELTGLPKEKPEDGDDRE
jgi:hypothetical protein